MNEYFVYFEGRVCISSIFKAKNGTECWKIALEYGNNFYGKNLFVIKYV